ncbi:hypothetical protein Q1695_011323 [Nippostrongylus brasiliensis]|nr:hypothetical protein Q1695_011323 [Nippostrongylus brasiliensis]
MQSINQIYFAGGLYLAVLLAPLAGRLTVTYAIPGEGRQTVQPSGKVIRQRFSNMMMGHVVLLKAIKGWEN